MPIRAQKLASADPMENLKNLVREHSRRDGEPLELAVHFVPKRARKHDLYIFEVLTGFGGNEPDRARRIMNISFGSTPGLPLPDGSELHMLLTSPRELETALLGGWLSLRPVLNAKREGRATVLFKSALGERLWRKMK